MSGPGTSHAPRRRRRFAAAVTVFALVAAGAPAALSSAAAHAVADDDLVTNGSFNDGDTGWDVYGAEGGVSDGRLCVDVPAGVNSYDAGIVQHGLTLHSGVLYTFSFTASSDKPSPLVANVQIGQDPWTVFNEADGANQVSLTTTATTYRASFTAADEDAAEIGFQLTTSEDHHVCVDDVSLTSITFPELAVNGSFDKDASGWDAVNLTGKVTDGRYCAPVPAGTAATAAVLSQRGLAIEAGHRYALTFDASGTPAANVTVSVDSATAGAPYGQWQRSLTPTATSLRYVFAATASDSAARIVFGLGANPTKWSFCLDNVSFAETIAATTYVQETGPRVRVNQVGYLPSGPKRATVVTNAANPITWQLKTSNGVVVAQGRTKPAGFDPTAGLSVHTIDFTSFTKAGKGFTLSADGDTSYPFDIGANVYDALRTDSIGFFYDQRSGTPILRSVAGVDPISGISYARAAGHVNSPADATDANPNLGDKNIPCQTADESEPVYGVAWTCDYTRDVTGGWYDAGDHGKYVVNGGIATAQLLSEYEQALWSGNTNTLTNLGDGHLAVPEKGNGVPDVLDNARWELEWMLKMQVPAGQQYAGMAFHKVHDLGWTGLPLDPAQDPQARELHRPSTAATLNLAAAAAQGARLFYSYDKEFSRRLLAAAITAYGAAKDNPAVFAPTADGANGGGAYDDANVADEFYWAASELYLTTNLLVGPNHLYTKAYLHEVLSSPQHRADVFSTDGFSWGSVAALGRMDLATVPSNLPDRKRVRASVLAGADAVLALESKQPFGQPYAPSGAWAWGSNSSVLNNLVVLGTAYTISHERKYRDGAISGMDYLLGRNALNRSYVTGFGTTYSQNEHSRMYGNELDANLPHPPPGSVSGGPNSDSSTWDPTWAGLVKLTPTKSCAPQFCYVDDIMSWSTNEVAVNWNSALAWVSGFLAGTADEHSRP